MIVMGNVVAALKELLEQFEWIDAIETGTIRSYNEKHESTRHISNTIGDKGKLISVDISSKSIKISKDICKNADNVTWVQSDSIEYLKYIDHQFHFVLLDSINDGSFIWKEFVLLAPRIVDGGVLIIDDAGIGMDGSMKDRIAPLAVKGHKVWKKLNSMGAKVKILDSPHGTQLRVNFDKKNKGIITKAIS